MLEDKMFVQYAKSLEALNLVFIEQLLSIEVDQMITWGYLKRVRNKSNKGKIPSWFKVIEERILEDKETRKAMVDFRTPVTNRLALRLKKVNLLEDKRKHDWILLDNKENEIDI